MKRTRSILIAATIVVVLVFAGLLGYWVTSTKGPSEVARAALRSNAETTVSQERGLITFEPIQKPVSAGLIFYPGAGVDFRSYAPLLREIAAGGFFVAIPAMPLGIAFLRTNAADEIIDRYPGIETWVVGGHSLGGVVAASYAAGHAGIAGLVLWASYPANDSLRLSEIRILSIYGSEDGLTTPEDIASSRALLPENASFLEISGGNHAQFGSYGPQGGDRRATITAAAQWAAIVEATSSFLAGTSDLSSRLINE